MGPRLILSALLAGAPVALGHTTAPGVTLRLGSHLAGSSPAHHLTFEVRAGDPEIFRAAIIYPDEFRFTGFRTLGPSGTPVGAYDLDFNFDGVSDRNRPLLALTSDLAYVDIAGDGGFSPATDPHLVHPGGTRFELRLPFGGDANPDTRAAPFGARATLTLFSGLMVSPAAGGRYQPTATLVTVDPETGDDDDGQGEAPVASSHQLTLDIAGPQIVPFASLSIDALDLKPDGREHFRFVVRGRYVPARASNGFDPRRDDVTVTIDWIRPEPPACRGPACDHWLGDRHALPGRTLRAFSQTISGNAFERTGPLHHFKGEAPGIERFWLGPDGRFRVDIRELTLMTVARTAAITLAIGDDRGTATEAVSGPIGSAGRGRQ